LRNGGQRLPLRLNNLLNEVFRRWRLPEELPDFPLLPVWRTELDVPRSCHSASGKKGYPAKQQAGAAGE